MPSPSPLVVSFVIASLGPISASGAGRAALDPFAAATTTNTERARMGLLPRRGSRSRVSYLDGADAPAAAVSAVAVAPADPPATPAEQPAAAEAPAIEATQPVTAVAVLERVVDQDGEIVLRLVGQGAAVLDEKVVGSLGDLPVLSSRRAEDGSVVQMVQDDWGLMEVRRDAVGRFVSARPVEGRRRAAD